MGFLRENPRKSYACLFRGYNVSLSKEAPKRMKFKLRQMEVFRAVMLTGSMNGAAKLLFISQPAVSRVIAYTEESLGLKLFHRERGRITPTQEAQLLFREVGALYEEAVRVDDFARDLVTRPQGVLHLCSSPSLALNFLPPVIAQFCARQPNVRIKFHTSLLSEMPHALIGRQADLGIAVLPVDHPHLLVESLTSGRMVCIVPEGHRLAGQPEVGLKDIRHFPLILYNRNIPFGQLLLAAFEQAGVPWRPLIEIERAELACAMVSAGAGIAIVDEFSIRGPGWRNVVIRPLLEEIPITLSIVRSRFDPPSQHVRTFIKLLKERHCGA